MVLVEFSITAVTEIVIVEFPIFLFTFFWQRNHFLVVPVITSQVRVVFIKDLLGMGNFSIELFPFKKV